MQKTNKQRVELIKQRLNDDFSPRELTVNDDSHKHAGHPGAKLGLGHFSIIIASEKLSIMPTLAAHRAIYQALGNLMQTDIHALSIKIKK